MITRFLTEYKTQTLLRSSGSRIGPMVVHTQPMKPVSSEVITTFALKSIRLKEDDFSSPSSSSLLLPTEHKTRYRYSTAVKII